MLLLLLSFGSANAKSLMSLKFELIQNNKVVEKGNTFVSQKRGIWKKGYTQRYAKLNCKPLPSGKIEKQMASEDHFSGLRVSHQIIEEQIELQVERIIIKSRLKEILALPIKDCQSLVPIISKQMESYRFPVISGVGKTQLFSDNIKLRVMIRPIRSARSLPGKI